MTDKTSIKKRTLFIIMTIVSLYTDTALARSPEKTQKGKQEKITEKRLTMLEENDRFTDNKNGTITHNKTGLVWTKKDSYADLEKCLDWEKSKKYVSKLETGGFTDWRMPTVKELKTIYQKKKNNKTFKGDTVHLDPVFSSGGAYWYWSSEVNSSCCAHSVYFSRGKSFMDFRDLCFAGGVRAVRIEKKN